MIGDEAIQKAPSARSLSQGSGPVRAQAVAQEIIEQYDRAGLVCWRDVLRLGIALGRENAGRLLKESDVVRLIGKHHDGPGGLYDRLRNDSLKVILS